MAGKTKYRIVQERDKCIGCGACVSVCPENWMMAEDSKARPKKIGLTEKEYKCNKLAEEACPVSIIHIKKL